MGWLLSSRNRLRNGPETSLKSKTVNRCSVWLTLDKTLVTLSIAFSLQMFSQQAGIVYFILLFLVIDLHWVGFRFKKLEDPRFADEGPPVKTAKLSLLFSCPNTCSFKNILANLLFNQLKVQVYEPKNTQSQLIMIINIMIDFSQSRLILVYPMAGSEISMCHYAILV